MGAVWTATGDQRLTLSLNARSRRNLRMAVKSRKSAVNFQSLRAGSPRVYLPLEAAIRYAEGLRRW